MIYLDNAATTQMDRRVLDAMMPFMTESYGNPGAIYSVGRKARAAIDEAREKVADFINAEPYQIIFTSGGTESNNTVFEIAKEILGKRGNVHVITTYIEHESVIRSASRLGDLPGFLTSYVTAEHDGTISAKNIQEELQYWKELYPNGMISVMHTNNETGAVNPLDEIYQICKDDGDIFFHTDCVQAAGCSELDVKKIGCDFMSLSSHKIHGPKGVGAVYIKNPRLVQGGLILGGKVQEFGMRGGTENVSGIVGFGEACSIMKKELHDTVIHTSSMKQLFHNTLRDCLKECNMEDIMHVNGPPVVRPGKILNIRFDGVDAETLLLYLDSKGVCISGGSACTALEQNPSHVLLAMGLSPEEARSSVRISFSRFNTSDEVMEAAYIVSAGVRLLKG